MAQRFFRAWKMLWLGGEKQPRSRVKGRLRPYAAWRSAPLTRRRGDTLKRGCERGISALTTCKQALFSAIFTRIYSAANNQRFAADVSDRQARRDLVELENAGLLLRIAKGAGTLYQRTDRP